MKAAAAQGRKAVKCSGKAARRQHKAETAVNTAVPVRASADESLMPKTCPRETLQRNARAFEGGSTQVKGQCGDTAVVGRVCSHPWR